MGIKELPYLEDIDLSSNRISDEGAIQILKNLPNTIKKLNFSNNKYISLPTIELLANIISEGTKK